MQVTEPTKFRSSIVDKLKTIIENEKVCKTIEKSIFNFCIKEAGERNIIKKWDNKYFVLLYTNRFRSVWFNISDDSYVENEGFVEKIKDGSIKPRNVGSIS